MDNVPQITLPDPADIWPHWHGGVETERLFLRPLGNSLAAEWLALHQDEQVAKYVVGPPLTPADCWRDLAFAIGHSILRGFSMWAVYEKETGAFVGRVGPWMPAGWPSLEIGWAMGPAGRGKGYGYESVEASLAWAHAHLKVPAAIHSIHPSNEASKKLATKLGAQPLGTADISGERHEVWVSDLAAFVERRNIVPHDH